MGAETGRLILDGPQSAFINMALDEVLFQNLHSPPTLRLYSWNPPALSLGYFQKSSSLHLVEFASHGMSITRRMTGGGAIVHWNELTYSFHVRADYPALPADTRESYRWMLNPVLLALQMLGVDAQMRDGVCAESKKPLCFDREHDLDITLGGIKIVGSAQRRSRQKICQHGSIIIAPNFWNPEIPDLSGPLSFGRLEEMLAKTFSDELGLNLHGAPVSSQEFEMADCLAREKYGNPDWVFAR